MSIDTQFRVEIVLMMARLESSSSVRRHFQRQNLPNIPSEKTIKAIYDKFIETGSVHDRERTGRPSLATPEKLDEIEGVLSNNAMVSVRRVSDEVDMPKTTVHRIMRNVLGYKPYKMHATQQLEDEDMDVRVVMSEILLPILDAETNDGLIFFSDEATFHVSGMVHKHNCRIWARENPFATVEVAMNSPKVIVWCAMSSKTIVGPFFLKNQRSINIIILICSKTSFIRFYKGIGLLEKLFSSKMEHLFISQSQFVCGWMRNSVIDGLAEVDPFHGLHDHLI